MFWIIVSVAIPLLIVLLWLILKIRRFAKVYSPGHYVEFAELLSAATSAACDRIGPPLLELEGPDPRGFVSSTGLAVVYTIVLENGEYRRHFSVSMGSNTMRAKREELTGSETHTQERRINRGGSRSRVLLGATSQEYARDAPRSLPPRVPQGGRVERCPASGPLAFVAAFAR